MMVMIMMMMMVVIIMMMMRNCLETIYSSSCSVMQSV